MYNELKKYFKINAFIMFIIILVGCQGEKKPYLLDLEISGGLLSPSFRSDIKHYDFELNESVEYTFLSAVSAFSDAPIFYNVNASDYIYIRSGDTSEKFKIKPGKNTIRVICVYKNKIDNYYISIGKQLREEILLESLSVTPGLMAPDFSPEIKSYRVGLPNRAGQISLQQKSDNSIVSYSLNSSEFIVLENQLSSKYFNVRTGKNELQIKVEKEGFRTSQYNINVVRYENADLKSISISPGVFNEKLAPENAIYTASVKSKDKKVNLELIPVDVRATITLYRESDPKTPITSPYNRFDFVIASETEEFKVYVKATDGYKRIYTFTVSVDE